MQRLAILPVINVLAESGDDNAQSLHLLISLKNLSPSAKASLRKLCSDWTGFSFDCRLSEHPKDDSLAVVFGQRT